MMALLRWISAGLLAALPVAAWDAFAVMPGPEGASASALLGLTFAFHLGVGAALGGLLGLASIAAGGLTLDGMWQAASSAMTPLRRERARAAAGAFATPVVLLGLTGVLLVLNLRFFKFNNQRLAALLLALVTIGAVGFSLLVLRAAIDRLEPIVRRAGERWPGIGDAPVVWLMPALGVGCGAIVGFGLRRANLVAENWEALDLAPYVGLLITAVFAALGEVLLRRLSRGVVLGAVAATVVAGLGAWTVALGSGPQGVDNDHLRRSSDVTRLYLTLAERATDRDGDGFSPHFGHGDCDDTDKLAFPGSPEGNDCGPEVELADDDEFEARLRGTPVAVAPPAPSDGTEAPGLGESDGAGADGTGADGTGADGTGGLPAPDATTTEPADDGTDATDGADGTDAPDGADGTDGTNEKPVAPVKPPAPRLKRPYNVVLITVDTVRADHMHFLGYERETTDNLDALAAKSAVFEKAYSPSNMTPIAIPAMLTGRYTSELYRDDAHFIRFSDENTFVAERLQAAGVQTRAVVTHWYFEKRKRSGLYQGFDDWQVVGTRWGKEMEGVATSKLVADEGISQLGQMAADKPFFLWLHFLDPHKWYIFHDGFEKRWGRASKDRYDHEIAFTDHHIGRVLDAIEKHPAGDRTAIIMTSDHGEAFGEHKTAFHGFSVYEDQLLVPLIVHVPDIAPQRIKKRVGLIDMTPTILDLMDVRLPADEPRLQGVSWAPELLGQAVPQRLIYSERVRGPHSGGMRALIDGDWKLIWRAAGNRYELYNLATDAKEANNVFGSETEVAERMQRLMATLQKRALDTKGKVRRR